MLEQRRRKLDALSGGFRSRLYNRYGFGDGHINKILTQALKREKGRRLLIISQCKSDDDVKRKSEEISKALSVKTEQVVAEKGSTKTFLETADLHIQLLALIPKPPSAPF